MSAKTDLKVIGTVGGLFVVVLSVVVGIVYGLTCWTDRNLEFWLSFYKHSTVQVPFWISLLMTIVGNVLVVAFNIISELLKLVV